MWRGLAKLRPEQSRRHGDHVDAGALGGIGLVKRRHTQHGQLSLTFHVKKIGNGWTARLLHRSPSGMIG
ncbi:hypothetical protein EV561_105238 [Rhizobium sp. BK376]|nr:hypothetical protein EV561_105238 [Rhizobium sp. BK376]